MEKKLDSNYTRVLQAKLNKSWRQQLYGHLLPITKTIQVRQTRHAEHCWRSRDELISDILLWSTWMSKAGRPARTYIQQLYTNTGCTLKTNRERCTIEKGQGDPHWQRDMMMMTLVMLASGHHKYYLEGKGCNSYTVSIPLEGCLRHWAINIAHTPFKPLESSH